MKSFEVILVHEEPTYGKKIKNIFDLTCLGLNIATNLKIFIASFVQNTLRLVSFLKMLLFR